jgi:long-subunit acyl-CoA synthetase (AMP-forming)
VEAFHFKCEAFFKVPRLFEDIYREMEALIRKSRLFQRLRGFLKANYNGTKAFLK